MLRSSLHARLRRRLRRLLRWVVPLWALITPAAAATFTLSPSTTFNATAEADIFAVPTFGNLGTGGHDYGAGNWRQNSLPFIHGFDPAADKIDLRTLDVSAGATRLKYGYPWLTFEPGEIVSLGARELGGYSVGNGTGGAMIMLHDQWGMDYGELYLVGIDPNSITLANFLFPGQVVASAPTVTTAAQASVASTTAVLGGSVTADGGATVSARGIVWATTVSPTTANNKVQIGSGTGSFSQTVTGLPASTLVYVRAYATNTAGTSYGSQVSFTTLAADTTPPTVASVTRLSPTGQATNSSTVTFRVTYSESVSGVATGNFAVAPANGSSVVGQVTGVSGSGATRDVTVTISSGSGEFGLKVVN